MAEAVTPEQERWIAEHRQRMDIETFTLHHGVPAGSEVLIGRAKDSGRVFWIEVMEPEPTGLHAYDTGDWR